MSDDAVRELADGRLEMLGFLLNAFLYAQDRPRGQAAWRGQCRFAHQLAQRRSTHLFSAIVADSVATKKTVHLVPASDCGTLDSNKPSDELAKLSDPFGGCRSPETDRLGAAPPECPH